MTRTSSYIRDLRKIISYSVSKYSGNNDSHTAMARGVGGKRPRPEHRKKSHKPRKHRATSHTTNWQQHEVEKGFIRMKTPHKTKHARPDQVDTRSNHHVRLRTNKKQKRAKQGAADQHLNSLDDQIEAFAQVVELAPNEKAHRDHLVADIRDLVCTSYPSASVNAYGSSKSGLETFRSDVDLTVGGNLRDKIDPCDIRNEPEVIVIDDSVEDDDVNQSPSVDKSGSPEDSTDMDMSLNIYVPPTIAPPSVSQTNAEQLQTLLDLLMESPRTKEKSPWNPSYRSDKLRRLHALRALLRTERPSLEIKLLRKAKIPILMVLEPDTQFSIDIGVHEQAFLTSGPGISTSIVSGLQRILGRPYLALVAVLKEFLHQNDLDKPFTGGLGSYRLYMMVASIFPSHLYSDATSARAKTVSTGKLLVEFLSVFGNIKQPGYFHQETNLALRIGRQTYSCGANFMGVFRLDACVNAFAKAHRSLSKSASLESILSYERMRTDREAMANRYVL